MYDSVRRDRVQQVRMDGCDIYYSPMSKTSDSTTDMSES